MYNMSPIIACNASLFTKVMDYFISSMVAAISFAHRIVLPILLTHCTSVILSMLFHINVSALFFAPYEPITIRSLLFNARCVMYVRLFRINPFHILLVVGFSHLTFVNYHSEAVFTSVSN